MANFRNATTSTKLSFVLNDFSGGLVNNVNDAKMLDSQSPDMLNMQFRLDGLLQKRPGTVFINECPVKDEDLLDVIPYEYAPDRHKIMYLTTGGLYFVEQGETLKIWTNTNGSHIKYIHFMGALIFTDGSYLYKFDYNDKTISKIVNPPASFTPKPKPAIKGENKKKLIDTVANGFAKYYEEWYEPCQFEAEDGYNGTNFIPPCIDCLAVHKDRIYISGGEFAPNMIWISDILNPFYFPSGLPIQTPPDDDYITALHVYNDNLIIGRRDSIYALFGNTNRGDSAYQYNLVKVNCHTGMANYYSANNVYHLMFFVGSDGNFYKLNPPTANANTLHTSCISTNIDITLPPFNFVQDDIQGAITIFDSVNGLWYVQLADETLVYSYNLRAWTRYNNINAICFFKMNNVVYFARNTNSYYRFADKEGNQHYYDEYYDPDAGKVITLPVCAYWTSKNMDFGVPARVKQFRDTYVTSESFEDCKTTVNVKYEVDYTDIYSTFVVENEISKWDKAIFDKHKFTTRNIDRSLPLMINRRGRTLKVYYGCGYKYQGCFPTFPPPGLVEENKLIYVLDENKLYLRVARRDGYTDKKDRYFMEFPMSEMNQALLVHNIMGIYELKGYR